MSERRETYADGDEVELGDIIRIATPTDGWSFQQELVVKAIGPYGDIVVNDRKTGHPILGVHPAYKFCLLCRAE